MSGLQIVNTGCISGNINAIDSKIEREKEY